MKAHFIYISICLLVAIVSCKKVNEDCNRNDYLNAPEESFYVSYNGTGEESHGHFILTCSDGGYLQIGETGNIPNSAKILVVKTDAEGGLLWKQEFSDGGHCLGNSAIEVDNGYLICGALSENSTIFKLDKTNGTVLFQKSFDIGGSDAFEHIVETQNGIVAIGYVNAEDNLNTFYTGGEGYITFLNSQGEMSSNKSIDEYISHAYRVKSYNNELIVSGLSKGAEDFVLIKMDSSGNVIWSDNYGGASADHCFGMDVANDGSIFLTGHTLSGTENWDTYTIKISNDGDQIWESVNGNPRGFKPKFIHDEAWGVKSTGDGGCIIAAGTGDEYGRYKRKCGTEKENSNSWQVYLVKLDQNGNVEWQQTYGENGVDWAGEDIDLTNDGAVIVAVDDGGFGFLKLDSF
jgi:hypothetical protein